IVIEIERQRCLGDPCRDGDVLVKGMRAFVGILGVEVLAELSERLQMGLVEHGAVSSIWRGYRGETQRAGSAGLRAKLAVAAAGVIGQFEDLPAQQAALFAGEVLFFEAAVGDQVRPHESAAGLERGDAQERRGRSAGNVRWS